MIESLIVAVLVIWSAIFVFKKVFTKSAYSVFSKLSQFFQARGWTRLAQWTQPAMVSGCGGGCGCSTNEPETTKKSEVQAVKWK